MTNLAYLLLRIKEYVPHSLLWLSSTLSVFATFDEHRSGGVELSPCWPCPCWILCQLFSGESLSIPLFPSLFRQFPSWEEFSLVFHPTRRSYMAAGLTKMPSEGGDSNTSGSIPGGWGPSTASSCLSPPCGE